jgi:hypothetical protein
MKVAGADRIFLPRWRSQAVSIPDQEVTMKVGRIQVTRCGFIAALIVTGCSTTYDGPRSGFLPDSDYSKLEKGSAPGGGKRYAYISDQFKPFNYNALIIEHLQFYPEPQPTDAVSMDTLNQIRSYIDDSVRTKFGQKVRLVDQPGPGVARLKLGITAVGEERRALKPYQYLPIGLAITGAVALAQGGLPHDTQVAFETEVTDSVSKQPLLVSVRGGTGERATKDEGQHVVTMNELKPLIDKWTDAAAEDATNYIKAK